jgi:hypothetical protein
VSFIAAADAAVVVVACSAMKISAFISHVLARWLYNQQRSGTLKIELILKHHRKWSLLLLVLSDFRDGGRGWWWWWWLLMITINYDVAMSYKLK